MTIVANVIRNRQQLELVKEPQQSSSLNIDDINTIKITVSYSRNV